MDLIEAKSRFYKDLPGLLAVVAAIALAVIFACRPIVNADMGYHLAFGKALWQNGEIVDTSDELCYTVDRESSELGPGQWWGDDGRMHFVSANWGTQAVLWPVWKTFGPDGLIALKMILVCVIFILAASINIRFGVPNWLNALTLVIIALAGYERFNIRPELFSYALILGQFHLLLNLFTRRSSYLRWPTIIALAVLQLLMVTLHSFFVFSWLLLGLLIAESLVLAGVYGLQKKHDLVKLNYALAGKLMIALLIMIAVSFINPWTWRLVYLPFELILTTHVMPKGENPYLRIGEISSPFVAGAWNQTLTLKAYVVALCFTAVGAIAGVFRKRWAMLALMGLLFTQTIAMRRNILLGSLLMLPAAAGCLWWFAQAYLPELKGKKIFAVKTMLTAMVILTIAFLVRATMDNSLYFNDRRNLSFGGGMSHLSIPAGPAGWINDNKPLGRIWCDFDSSSNALFFIEPQPKLPALTNTWATPLSSMLETLGVASGKIPWSTIENKYSPEIILIKTNQANSPLLRQLEASSHWAVVYIDAQYAVFLRRNGINAMLARDSAIAQKNIDVEKYIKNLENYNDVTPLVLQAQAVTFQRFGWFDKAIEMSRRVVERYPDYHEAWFELGASYCLRGSIVKQRGGFEEAIADFRKGRECFRKCLQIEPSYYMATYNLQQANEDINQTSLLVE